MGKITKKVRGFCEENPELASTIIVGSAVGTSMLMGYRIGRLKMVVELQNKLLEDLKDNYEIIEPISTEILEK